MPSATDVIETWLRSEQPAVVFDFNGTLSDDEHILFDIFSELFHAHLGWAMTAEDYRDELLGRSDREIIERVVARHGRGTEDEVTELLRLRQGVYKQKVADHNPIGASAAQLVKLLADNQIPVGIVTGAQREDVLAVLDGSPTGELVSVLIAEEDVNNGKPHPEGFLDGSADTEPPAQRCTGLRRFGARRAGRSGCGHALHRRLRRRARPGAERRGPGDRGRVVG